MMSTATWVGQELAAGRYAVTARLGEGGMGFVYRARDRNLETDVVIKVPRPGMLDDPQFSERFNREIRSLVRLAHPHIVKVTDVGNQQGAPYAVMQYLPGGSLKDRQAKDADGKPVPARPEEILDWLPDLAAALDFIHTQGYLHRDVKPANILFDEHGHVYLSDFGVVKALMASAQAAQTGSLTMTGMIVGTPEYMAPELLLGQPCDGRADQYALAVTVYEVLGGRRPFEGTTPALIVMQQVTAAPPPLQELNAGLPPAVYQAVLKAMAKDPGARYPSCVAFAHAVADAVRAAPATAADPVTATVPLNLVRLPCPACSRTLALGDKTRGRRVRCPGCQSVWRVADDLQHLVAVPQLAGDTDPRRGVRSGPPVGIVRTPVERPPPAPVAPADPETAGTQGPRAWLLVGGGVTVAILAALGMGLAVTAAVIWWPRTAAPSSIGSAVAVQPEPTPDPEPPTVVVSATPGEGRYTRISDALGAVAPGTRIKVRPGVYNEAVVVNKRVEIIGDGPTSEVVVQNSASNCISIQADSAVVRGLTVRGQAGQTKESGWYAVNLSEGEALVEDCDITSNSLACVAIHGDGARPTLRRCKLHGGASGGLFIYDNGEGVVEDCEIYANTFAGVEVRAGGNPVLRRCRIHDGKQGGVLVHTSGRGTFEDCDITDNTLSGVAIRKEGNPTFRKCRINRNKLAGVAAIDNARATFEDCDLSRNMGGAWDIAAGCDIRKSGNREDPPRD
jgi:parallel beta-helix repeat protein